MPALKSNANETTKEGKYKKGDEIENGNENENEKIKMERQLRCDWDSTTGVLSKSVGIWIIEVLGIAQRALQMQRYISR